MERGRGASASELHVVVLAVVELVSRLGNALNFTADFEREDHMSVDLSASSHNKHYINVHLLTYFTYLLCLPSAICRVELR